MVSETLLKYSLYLCYTVFSLYSVTSLHRSDTHSAPILAISSDKNINIFFRWNIRKQFYETALGNCYGWKLPKCSLQFKKKSYCVTFIGLIFGTLSFPICPHDCHGSQPRIHLVYCSSAENETNATQSDWTEKISVMSDQCRARCWMYICL